MNEIQTASVEMKKGHRCELEPAETMIDQEGHDRVKDGGGKTLRM